MVDGTTSPPAPAMVISAEPPPAALPSDPTAEGAVGEVVGADAAAEAVPKSSSDCRGALSSLPSTLKTCGSHRDRVLRSASLNQASDTIRTERGSTSQKLDEDSERLLLGLREVAEKPAAGNPAENESLVVGEVPSPQPSKARTRRRRRPEIPSRGAGAAVSVTPQMSGRERRLVRADALDRPRFSATLSAEEIDEDLYALTGALPRSHPRRRPRAVQNQLDRLLPGARLSEITVESYRVPDDH